MDNMVEKTTPNDVRSVAGHAGGKWLGAPSLPSILLAPLLASPLAMAVIDEFGTIIGWNERATELLGWHARDVVGTRIEQVILPHHLIELYHEIMDGRPSDDARITTRRFSTKLRARDQGDVEYDIALASSLDVNRVVYVAYAWRRGEVVKNSLSVAG